MCCNAASSQEDSDKVFYGSIGLYEGCIQNHLDEDVLSSDYFNSVRTAKECENIPFEIWEPSLMRCQREFNANMSKLYRNDAKKIISILPYNMSEREFALFMIGIISGVKSYSNVQVIMAAKMKCIEKVEENNKLKMR